MQKTNAKNDLKLMIMIFKDNIFNHLRKLKKL